MIKLKKLCTLITKGTSPSTYGYNFEKNGIKFIRSENLSDSRLLTNVNLFISKEANNVLKRSIINENDILMSIAGAYLGKLAFVTKKDIPSNTNQAVAIIRIDAKNALPMYIYYYLSSDKINKYINNINSQSAQPNINLKQVGNIPIKLHSIDEQQHIVDIIGSIDDKIENNNKIIEQLKKYLYLQTNNIINSSHRKILLGNIITESKEKITKEEIPYSVVNTGEVINQNEQFNKEIAKNVINKYKLIQKNDFVYNPSRINIGSIGKMKKDVGCVSPIYIVFKVKKEYIYYLNELLKFENIKLEFNKKSSGSVRQALSFDTLCSIEINDIEDNTLNKYNEKYDEVDKIINFYFNENIKLQKLKQNYLLKFFR